MWIKLKPKQACFFFPPQPPILAINCTQATLPSPAMQHDTPGSTKNTRELGRTAICLLRFYKEQDIKWDTSSSSFARLMPSLLIKTRILPSAVHCSLLPRDAVGRCSSARRGGSCVHYYGGECFLQNLLPRLMSHVPSHRLESFKLINTGNGLINLTY